MSNIEQYIRLQLQARFDRLFDDAFKREWIEGDGSGEPMGLEEALDCAEPTT